MLAAVAGILVALRSPSVNPLMGLMVGLKAFVAAVLGGIGNITGAVAGGLLLGMIETLVSGYFPQGSQYKDGVAFVILILVLLVKPSGLLGRETVEKV
jgi:branched-chain amino acid transport system permease protein